MPLIRNILVVGAGTLALRLSGFVRDVLFAAVIGAGATAEAWVAAMLLPNLFRRALGEGALNTAFVPIHLRRYEAEGHAGTALFFRAALGGMLIVAVVGVLVAQVVMPLVIRLVAPGFDPVGSTFAEAVLYGRIAFVYVGCVVVSALLAAVLNARGRFAAVVLAAPVLNGLLILALLALTFSGRGSGAGVVLSATIVVAGLVQLGMMVRAASSEGVSLSPLNPIRYPDVRRMFILALPAMALAGSGHFNLLLGAALSSPVPSAVAWLYYADRVFQLPLGFVQAAAGVVLLPAMAKALQVGDANCARRALFRTLEYALLLALPAAIALFLLSFPITDVVYRRGAFTIADAEAVADVLRALALGLPGFVLGAVFLPPFAVKENLRLPLLAVGAALAVNLIVTLALRPGYGALAAPLGVAAAAWTNALILGVGLALTGRLNPDETARRRLPAIALAAAGTGAIVAILVSLAGAWLDPGQPFPVRSGALIVICALGLGAHGALALALRVSDAGELRSMLGRKP